MQSSEITIPVQWGHLAVKTWGDKSNEAVILLHGLYLNANTFDNLITSLPEKFYYICPDLPGHGRSSPFFGSLPIHYSNYLAIILLVMQHFKQDRYILIGHCFGATLSTNFTQLYPEKVKKLFLIDHLFLSPYEPEDRFQMLKGSIDRCVNPQQNKKVVSYEQARQWLMSKEYFGRLDQKCTDELLTRALTKVGDDQYIINNDTNLKYIVFYCTSSDFIIDMMRKRPITQDCVLIKASEALYREPFQDLIRLLPKLRIVELEGDHHIHHKSPHLVAPYIENFLLNSIHKL